jgi:hypothetical protein
MTYLEIKTQEDSLLYQDYKREVRRHKSTPVRNDYWREDHDLFRWESDLREIEDRWRQIFAEIPVVRDSEPEPEPPRPPSPRPSRRPSRRPPVPRPPSRRSTRVAAKRGELEVAEAFIVE